MFGNRQEAQVIEWRVMSWKFLQMLQLTRKTLTVDGSAIPGKGTQSDIVIETSGTRAEGRRIDTEQQGRELRWKQCLD